MDGGQWYRWLQADMFSVEFLATTVVPVMALLFVGAIGFGNLFHNVRKRFPTRVNCWFCNTNTRVPYESSNSWFCPSCTQYNGFKEDGDYNREIPGQYQSRLNAQANVTDDDKISYSAPPRNGLCFGCNRNQELKIHQLASFVPEEDENYDAEVDEYQRQLEQVYKLCSRCERIVKRTLNDVKRNILGCKLAQIGTRGLKVFDHHMEVNGMQQSARRRQTVANVCLAAVTLLVLVKVAQIGSQLDLSLRRLEAWLAPELSQALLIAVSYGVALRDTLIAQWNGFLEQPTVADGVSQLKCARDVFSQYWTEKVEADLPDGFADDESPEMVVAIPRHVLSNLALIGLSGTLLAMKLHAGSLKPVAIIACSVAEIALKTDYARQVFHTEAYPEWIWLLPASISLMAALGCIGKTSPKVKPSDDVNSSFHKIYSQQANDADVSADCTDDSSSILLQDASTCSSRKLYQPENAPAMMNNQSAKSLDTTKSISPSALSASTLRPFLDTSFGGHHHIRSPRSHFDGSVLSVSSRLNSTFQEQHQPLRSISRGGLMMAHSPSVSVDHFTTAIAGPNESTLGYGVDAGGAFSKYGFSTSCLNKVGFPEEDRFGDDIDRLSISGRLSVSRRDLTMVNNPFATHHVDRRCGDDGYSLRHRKVTISPPQLGTVAESGSSWLAGGYWGSSSPQKTQPGEPTFTHPYMSRTSSQSSGFESQPTTTRRPTPEEVELDRVSLFSEPAGMIFASNASSVSAAFPQPTPRLNQTFHLPLLPQSSPALPSPSHVPSSSSFFSRPASSHHSGRSLFGESNLFSQQQQQQQPHGYGSPPVPSLIFPPHHSHTPVFGGVASNSAFAPGGHLAPTAAKTGTPRRSLLNLSKLGGGDGGVAEEKPIEG